MIARARKSDLPKPPPSQSERDRDAVRKRQTRAIFRIVKIPRCANPRRRARLEADDEAWLRWYFAPESGSEDPFTYDFTSQQREMISAIRNAIIHGGDQSIAASRGEGKTTYFERMLLKYTLQGEIKFAVLFAATGGKAEDSLEAIKGELENNKRLLADYPEACVPVIALEGAPQRAGSQLVSGIRHDNGKPYEAARSKFSWCGQEIYLPKVPGAPSSGAIIATRGLDAAVRGIKKKGRRVDVAGIDDPDTEDTARSEEQAKKLEERIDRAIAGLGGQKRSVARVMLTTLQNRTCVSYKFTDEKQKGSWKPKRFKFMIRMPERMDLWEEYIRLRSADWTAQTNFAHELYVANREAMDAGAEVANSNRYVTGELSAIQHFFNLVERIGWEAVNCEYQNDPPEETGPVESGITANRIRRQVSGYDRKIIPPGCTIVVQGIDVRKVALHFVVRAWRPDGTGFTIDYGIHEVHGTIYGSDEGVDVAIKKAILARIEATKAADYATLDGEIMPVDLTLVDAGWRTAAVYAACSEAGMGVMPVMGFGKSAGCAQANFSDIQHKTTDKKPGDGWFLSRKGSLWLVCADTDRWKSWEHDRWLTSPGKPGVMTVFGVGSGTDRMSKDEEAHHSYAHHLCNEVEVEEPHKGTMRRRWKSKSENNHYLDASYYGDVAANMKGIKLLNSGAKATDIDNGGRRKVVIPDHMRRR